MAVLNIVDNEQIGSYKSISFIPLDEIVNCPGYLTNKNASEFTYTPGEDSIQANFLYDSITIKQKPTRTKSGLLYRITAQFDFTLQHSKIDDYLNSKLPRKCVVISLKHYGQQKLYGSLLNPLTMIYEFRNGKTAEEGSTVRVKIIGKISQKPVFIMD